jgi:hypothetical protein
MTEFVEKIKTRIINSVFSGNLSVYETVEKYNKGCPAGRPQMTIHV